MSWVKLDDRANEHRKLLVVGAAAAWLWTCGLMYCNRQSARDGFIPDGAVPTLYGPLATDRKIAAKLVAAGLWDRVEGGYRVHDYHDYQPSQGDWAELTAKRRMAGSLGGKAKANGKHVAKQVATESKQTASNGNSKTLPVPDPVPGERSQPTPARPFQAPTAPPPSGTVLAGEVLRTDGGEPELNARRAKALADAARLAADPTFAAGGGR